MNKAPMGALDRALVRRYRPLGVREWGAWNEVNHKTQPTWKSPKRAAQFPGL